MDSVGSTGTVDSRAWLPSLMLSRVFVTALTVQSVIVLSGFVLHVRHLDVPLSSCLSQSCSSDVSSLSFPDVKNTNHVFVFKILAGLSVVRARIQSGVQSVDTRHTSSS